MSADNFQLAPFFSSLLQPKTKNIEIRNVFLSQLEGLIDLSLTPFKATLLHELMTPILPTQSQDKNSSNRSSNPWQRPVVILSLGLGICLTACQSQTRNLEQVKAVPTATSETLSADAYSQPVIRFGVLSSDSAISVNNRYRPLLDYLESKMGRRFELITLNQDSQFDAVKRQQLDFITNNPIAAVQLRRLYDIQFLVTTRRPEVGTQFGGVIIVRADSGIETIEDLRGKQMVCVDAQTAAGGCVFQIDYLRRQEFDLSNELSQIIEINSQDNIVLAVLNGSVDVGFVRTGQLEKMLREQTITSLDWVNVFQAVDDDFPLAHTTALYPEWPIAALAETDPQLVTQVRQILLEIPPNHAALKAANFSGFVPAVDYQLVDDLIEPLKLKTWDTGDRTDAQ
jgi:phosphate/phosphite/phosphonate ABC transporter binding protein